MSMLERILAGAAGAVVAAIILSVVSILSGWIEDLFRPDVPEGAVVAFLDPCSEVDGWEDYDRGAGRFLLGANTEFKVGIPGGEKEHVLSLSELPNHQHWLQRPDNKGEWEWGHTINSDGNSTPRIDVDDGHPYRGYAEKLITTPVGQGEPHNNMPPYIPVYFCQKR